MILRMLVCALATSAVGLASASAQQSGSVSQGPGGVPVDVAGQVKAVRSSGGSDAWDVEVKAILLRAYDANKSGSIDTEKELAAADCGIWKALDGSVRAGTGNSTLITTYGFMPAMSWVGDALGISNKLRQAAYERLRACGLADK